MKSWQGKVAVVTGGSSGLGLAIARVFAQRGASVVVVARNAQRLESAKTALAGEGAEVLVVSADITQQAGVDRLFAETLARFGRVDALVNNAGRSARGEALATTPEEVSAMMDLNLIALVRCTRAAAPHLLKVGGHIVNIGSLAGKIGARYMGAYSATKFAVSGYTQQLRLELEPQGLHVLLVSPGPIARSEPRTYATTKLSSLPANAAKPGGGVKVKLLSPDWLADRIVDACERRRPELVVPSRARWVFAIAQLWPSLGEWIVRKLT